MLIRRLMKNYVTDGVIDLVPVYSGSHSEDLHFGSVLDWKITLHNRAGEIGRISLRTGEGVGIYYFGHIGYHIDPPFRGHRYAAHSCLLLKRQFRLLGLRSLVITVDPDNLASRRTCELVGAVLERIVDVPEEYQKKWMLSRRKCRYVWIPEDS